MVQKTHWIGLTRNERGGTVTKDSGADRVRGQMERGEIRFGPEAAREIAQRIEDQGGFWGPRSPKYGDPATKKKAVIYDFHSTLTNVDEVLYLIKEKRYDEFYAASLLCPPNENVVAAARHSHESGYANLLFTGMPKEYCDGLVGWLDDQNVPMDIIRMRPTGDFCKDFVLKERMYVELSQEYEVLHAWDDSPAVLDLWTSLGIPIVPMPRAVL